MPGPTMTAALTFALVFLGAQSVWSQDSPTEGVEEPIRLGFDSHISAGGPFGLAGVSVRYNPLDFVMLEAGGGYAPFGTWTAGGLVHFGWTFRLPATAPHLPPVFIGLGLGVNATDRECAQIQILGHSDCARDTLRGNSQLTFLIQDPSGWRLGGYLGVSRLIQSLPASDFEYGGDCLGCFAGGTPSEEEFRQGKANSLDEYQNDYFPYLGASLGYGF